MRQTLQILIFMVFLVNWTVSVSAAEVQGANDVNAPVLEQGKEVPFEYDGDELVLFIPDDYNAVYSWPIIFSYPGQGGKPSTGFFQAITESRGFIIVGMSYALEPNEPASRGRYMNYLKAEMIRIGRIKKLLEKEYNLNINERKMFLGGISKGGWFTSEAIEYRPRPWAGAIIIAAGRVRTADYPEQGFLKNKPIYIGVGEKDPNREAAEHARGYYRRRGARVKYEVYPGLGHAVKPDDIVLREWLRELIR